MSDLAILIIHLVAIVARLFGRERLLFTPKTRHKPGPKGPPRELIKAIVALKHRNPDWGCPKIAQQISLVFGVEIDKDFVRRI